MPNGAVRIAGMRFSGAHGVTVRERERPQSIELDLEITLDIGRATQTDSLADTVDYARLYALCERLVSQQSFALLETLADRIAQMVVGDPKVAEVVVRVRKPGLLEGATPEVEVRRSRPSD
jgi:7,8-dihydroneopterin aldolase/epimerase/oxygenase